MADIEGVTYGSFIVPGLIMLSILTQSISNASFGIFFPKFTGTIYEILSAPVSMSKSFMGYVGAAATKSVILGLIILATAALLSRSHRASAWMMMFLVLTAVTFSLFGFIIGVWADNFEKLQIIPLLIVTPLAFLGGSFYSISMLPPFWQNGDTGQSRRLSGERLSLELLRSRRCEPRSLSVGMIAVFLGLCMFAVWWIFKTGYRLKRRRRACLFDLNHFAPAAYAAQ